MFTADERTLIHTLLLNHVQGNKALMAHVVVNGKEQRYCMDEGNVPGTTIIARCEKENKQCHKLMTALANME